MTFFRQSLSALLILALLMIFNAPLLACQQAGHKCAMMSHESAAPAPAPMTTAEHKCCHGKKPAPGNSSVPPKKSCHGTAALMPAHCAASSSCCDMGREPAVNSVAT